MKILEFNELLEGKSLKKYSSFKKMQKDEFVHIVGEEFDIYGKILNTKLGGMRMKITRIVELPSDNIQYVDPDTGYTDFNSSQHLRVGSISGWGSYFDEDEETEFEMRDFFKSDEADATGPSEEIFQNVRKIKGITDSLIKTGRDIAEKALKKINLSKYTYKTRDTLLDDIFQMVKEQVYALSTNPDNIWIGLEDRVKEEIKKLKK